MVDLFEAVRDVIGIQLTPSQIHLFERYQVELLEWNARFNLTSIVDPDQIRLKHFVDSLTCLLAMGEPQQARLIDIGSGAGFPGIPIKIAVPSLQLTLVESIGKKAEFCRHLAGALELQNVQVLQARAEDAGQMPAHRQRYDWATARAVAELPVLLEYLLPLVRVGGCALAMKGSSAPAEMQSASRAITVLGGRLRDAIPIHLPGLSETRYLVVVEKASPTRGIYPRRAGVPAQKPL